MTQYLISKIELARFALAWERLWQCGWRSAAVAASGLAVFSTGLVDFAPDWARLAVVAVLAAAALWALTSFLHFRWPSRAEAVRRVEHASGLAHRPASGVADRLAQEETEGAQPDVWLAHRERLLAQLTSLKAGVPRPELARRDPYALRFLSALALIAGLVWSQGQISGNLSRALAGSAPAVQPIAVTADAWIRPPAYTAKPPVLLTSQAMREALARGEPIRVPENSMLTVRISGAAEPKLAMDGGEPVAMRKSEQSASAEVKLAADTVAVLSDGSKDVERWPITVIADQPPQVKFTAEPRNEPLGALVAEWQAEDDYGVSRIAADIQLSDIQDGELGLAGSGFFLYDPPAFPMSLKQSAPKSATGKAVNDLTAHPWAGLTVEMSLTARDAAGRTGTSEVKTFKLPERPFQQPLARALVEQRKALVAEPGDTAKVQAILVAFMAYPQGMVDESGVAAGISAVESRLRNAESNEDVKQAIATLWAIALAIEEGDLSGARAELEAIRKELEKALKEGAPPERIAELTDKLREAMNRYMREMAEEARKRAERGETPRQPSPNGRTVTQQDLQKMLDRIEELSKNGANDAAREMLSQLDELLRNLQPGMQAQPGQQGGPLSEMLDELSELMRRQQKLMDDTGRLPGQDGQNGMGEQPEGNEPGQRGGRMPQGGEGLADQQQALERMLEELQRRMGQQGLSPPESFGDAGKSMKGAEGKLRGGNNRGAQGDQGDALEALRDGARGMAKQLSEQQGTGSAGNPGNHGEARGDDRDPLGRPTANRGEDAGPDRDMLPGEIAVRRAREILEMLRGRANEPGRPRIERDYLERLLRGLF